MDALVGDLSAGAWTAVGDLQLHLSVVEVQLDRMFTALSRLPALRNCEIRFVNIRPNNQMVAALTSLFSNQIEITVTFGTYIDDLIGPGCETVNVIRQVVMVHRDLKVLFLGDALTMTLGKVTAKQEFDVPLIALACLDADCVECRAYYPRVLGKLISRANKRVRGMTRDVHLAKCRLDRCRVDTVVEHLN